MWLAYRYYIINLTAEHNIQGSPYLYPTLSVMIRPPGYSGRDEPPESDTFGNPPVSAPCPRLNIGRASTV